MVTMTYSNLSASNLDRAIKSKKFGRYVMLYLYDGYEEMRNGHSAAKQMLTKYGKMINSHLGKDFLLLTVYDKSVIDAWGDDFMGKEKLTKQFSYQESYSMEKNHYAVMKELAEIYSVRMPALVLFDTSGNENGRESVAKKEYPCWSTEDMYHHIMKTVDAIRDWYGDFAHIAAECETGVSSYEKRIREQLTVQQSLKEIVNSYMKKAKLTQKKLCEKLDINPRTLRRYMNEWDETGKSYPLPRDTAIAIAFLLKLSPEQADLMFDAAQVEAVPRLGNTGRDGIIRDCLENGFDLETTNRELKKYQWQTVDVKKQ